MQNYVGFASIQFVIAGPYDFPSEINFTTLLTPLMRIEDALARLDERLSTLAFGRGIAERLLYDEACACLANEGQLVLREDLVLFDAQAYDGPPSMALTQGTQILRIWKTALASDAERLLASKRPGEAVFDTPDVTADPIGALWHRCHGDILTAWRAIVRRTAGLPPVLAAVIAADAWRELQQGTGAAWRASLLAALVLKARRKTKAFLLPLDLGRRLSQEQYRSRAPFMQRMGVFLDWAEAAAVRVRKDAQAVVLAEQLMAQKLRGRRKTSRLPELVDLILKRPVISVPMAAKVLRVSPQAVERMLAELGSTPRLLTERKRYRVWGI